MRYEQRNNGPMPGVWPAPVKRFLTLDGGQTLGDEEATGDYSGAGDDELFWIAPPNNDVWAIWRMLVYFEGTGQHAAAKYGPIDALTNGIPIRVCRTSTGQLLTLTDLRPVKTTADYSRHCYDAQHLSWGTGADADGVRWTFQRGGAPLILQGEFDDRLEIHVSDDFSGLDSHTFKADGVVLLGDTPWDS